MAMLEPTETMKEQSFVYDLNDLVKLSESLSNYHSNIEHSPKNLSEKDNVSRSVSQLIESVNLLTSKYLNEDLDQDRKCFLDCFYVLSAEVLAAPSINISDSRLRQSAGAKKACQLIAKSILSRIGSSENNDESTGEVITSEIAQTKEENEKKEENGSIIGEKNRKRLLINALSVFCTGIPAIEKGDRDIIANYFKNSSKIPDGFIYNVNGEAVKNVNFASGKNSNEYPSSSMDTNTSTISGTSITAGNANIMRPQTDLTSLLFGQLSSPLEEQFDNTANAKWDSAVSSLETTQASNRNFRAVSNLIQQHQENTLNLKSKSEISSLMPSPFEMNESEIVGSDVFRNSSFVAKNTALLHGLKAGDFILDFCCNLPKLGMYISQWNDSGCNEVNCVPTSITDAQFLRQSLKELLDDIDITSKALSLPLLEPLTNDRLIRLSKIVMGCLIASVSVATAQNIHEIGENNIQLQTAQSLNIRKIPCQNNSGSANNVTNMRKECQIDGYASEIVEKSLDLFNTILATIRQSTRAGGHILQNYTMMGAWVLIKGLQLQVDSSTTVLEQKETKVEQSSTETFYPSTTIKPKKGLTVLSVALGSQALTLTAMLIEDISSEITDAEAEETRNIEAANVFDLFHPFMATQRVVLVLESAPFIPLLFNVAMLTYGKAGDLVKSIAINKNIDPIESPEISRTLNNKLCRGTMPSKTSLSNTIQKTPVIKPGKNKGHIDRSRNRRVGRSAQAAQQREIDDESTGEDEEDEDEDSDEDDTDENEMVQNQEENSDASDNEEGDPRDEDEDSEPLLGKWFEETLFPQENETSEHMRKRIDEEKLIFGVGGKTYQPSGFISLASHIFIFLNKHILTSESDFIKKFINSGLKEAQMFVIADIIKDMDLPCNVLIKDRVNNNGNKMNSYLGKISSLYNEFSITLSTFTHNLLAYGMLSSKMQNALLRRLSVCPWGENISELEHQGNLFRKDDAEWPLTVNTRTLALLAQILLLRQNFIEDDTNSGRDGNVGSYYPQTARQSNTYVTIWEKVLSKLTKCITDDSKSSEEIDSEDLNIEHAQLLLFLFHALGLMQKKQVLLFAGNCIIKVSGMLKDQAILAGQIQKRLRSNQLFYISRLILLFEYIMTHLYEPTKLLLEQVQTNIFRKQCSSQPSNNCAASIMYHSFSKIENNVQNEGNKRHVAPKYYNLFPLISDNGSGTQGQEEGPITLNKLDGLACSFVLGTPDALQYGQLYQALIDILNVVHLISPNFDQSFPPDKKIDEAYNFQFLGAIQYCFGLCWRLLQSMPPSIEFIEHLIASKYRLNGSEFNVPLTTEENESKVDNERDARKETRELLDTCSLLHSLLLLPRVEQKAYGTWVKDCLVKQGQTMAKAEELVKKCKSFNTFAYDVGCMKNLLQYLTSKENVTAQKRTFISAKRSSLLQKEDLPHFFDLLVLDATMAKVQISLDRMFSGVDSSGGTKSATATTREQVAASAVERLLGVTEQLADAVDAAHDLVPLILQLVESFSVCAKSLVLHSADVSSQHVENEVDHQTNIDDTSDDSNVTKNKTESGSAVKKPLLSPVLLKCLSVSGSRCQHTAEISQRFNSFFPLSLRSAITAWNETSLLGFPPVSSWRSSVQTDNCASMDFGSNPNSSPFEAYISSVVNTHVATITTLSHGTLLATYHAKSLKHCLYSAARFAGDLFVWYPESSHLQNDLVRVLFPLILDGCSENLSDLVSLTLERLIGVHDSDEFLGKVYQHVLTNLYGGIVSEREAWFFLDKITNDADEKILHEVLRFMESMLDKAIGRHTLDAFFNESPEHSLVQVLLSIAPPILISDRKERFQNALKIPSSEYTLQVLSFFNKLFVSAEKYPDEPSTKRLCASLAKLSDVSQNELENWLRYLVSGIYQQEKVAKTLEEKTLLQENIQLLQALTNYIVSESNPVPEEVALTILNCLLSKNIGSELLLPTSEGMPFSDLMVVLKTLASAESGVGHVQLFRACTEWMSTCRNYIVQKNVIEKLEKGSDVNLDFQSGNDSRLHHKPGHMVMVENACHLLSYMSDVVFALKHSASEESKGISDATESVSNDTELSSVPPYDWIDDGSFKDEFGGIAICGEDSGAEDEAISGTPGEDSDDEGSHIDNRLCTFTQTQKEFMNQHWYHCHTCRMVDGVGVCAICAKVCHSGHDVTYSKHGSFFCDCGAKEDNSCMAMTKRTPGNVGNNISESHTSFGMLAIAPRRQDLERRQSSNILNNVPSVANSEPSESVPSALAASSGNYGSYEQEHITGALRRIMLATSTFNIHGSTVESNAEIAKQRQKLAKKLGGWKDVLSDEIAYSGVAANLLELLKNLLPVIKTSTEIRSTSGRLAKLKEALAILHEPGSKVCEQSEQLILPTLGSQEGAFENVRMNYSGEQGQTIRQLVTTHAVRRVVMCCLASSPLSSGKRQHLAVSHEKGKITVLQLSALLKQADSSQKKLTLTRLASAPVPFTVLSIVPNPCNEDYLAVTGIKDCHILTFNGNNSGSSGGVTGRPGEVTAHLVLHPQLDANNYIIKSIWMPGSQTEIALVTADFIKIYNLGKDALSPEYFFLVPSGKVRDCTLAIMEDGSKFVLIMSSAGHIYFQQLTQESSAGNGPFYVTNIMDISHPFARDNSNNSLYDANQRNQGNNGNRNDSLSQNCSSEQIGGGGVSIYYSQSLQCLFFSYAKGKSFMAPLSKMTEEIKVLFPLQIKPFSGSGVGDSGATTSVSNSNAVTATAMNKNSSSTHNSSLSSQPLCQWSEIQGHPGLITAFLQTSNNPVVILVRPNLIQIQEIKIGTKAKIVDMVAIRHNTTGNSNSDQRTTLILLCEDGSLKIYMAALGESGTEFWLPSMNHPMSSIAQQKPPRKVKKVPKRTGHDFERQSSQQAGLLPTFPIDYFESCSTIADVEFGGIDVLQVYNVQQIKHRLQTTSLYIANTKPTGFELEVSNHDANQVIVGVRVMLGSQDTSRVPSYIELFGRRLPIGVGGMDGRSNLTRGRWFELPLTRDESLSVGGASIGVTGSDKPKLVITFGPSLDPGSVNIIDSVQVYGKSKEVFGWPEDPDEGFSGIGSNASAAIAGGPTGHINGYNSNSAQQLYTDKCNFGHIDRIITGALEILDGCFAIQAAGSSDESLVIHKEKALELTSQLITIATQTRLELCCKALLASLFPSPALYYNHKDQTLLNYVALMFNEFESGEKEIDIDTFQKLVLVTRGVAITRPQNLIKFMEHHINGACRKTKNDTVNSLKKTENVKTIEFRKKFMMQLSEWFWQLIEDRSVNNVVAPVGQQQLTFIEATVQALVEIFHAFTTTTDIVELESKQIDESISFAAQIYGQFLISENKQVSFAAKQALIRVLRPKTKRRKQHTQNSCSNPQKDLLLSSSEGIASQSHPAIPRIPPPVRGHQSYPQQPSIDRSNSIYSQQEQEERSQNNAAALGMGPGGIGLGGIAGNLAALLPDIAGAGGVNIPPPVLDMPAEVDDEAMVELAIALSLQEQNADGAAGAGAEIAQLQQGLQGLQQGLQQLANLGGQAFDGYPGLQGLAGILGEAGVVGLPPDVEEEDEVMFNQQQQLAEDSDISMDVVPVDQMAVEGGEDAISAEHNALAEPLNNDPSHYSDTTASAPSDEDDDEVMESEPQRDASGSSPANINNTRGTISNNNPIFEGSIENVHTEAANYVNPEPVKKHEHVQNGTKTENARNEGNNYTSESDWEQTNSKLNYLRRIILEELLQYLPSLRNIGGVRCIPFMQVLLLLTTDLTEKDSSTLDLLLSTLIKELNVVESNEELPEITQPREKMLLIYSNDLSSMATRSNIREMQLVILRLFSVLMSRSKSWQSELKQIIPIPNSSATNIQSGSMFYGANQSANSSSTNESPSNFVSSYTADVLVKAGANNFSLSMLKGLLEYWKSATHFEEEPNTTTITHNVNSNSNMKVGGCNLLRDRPPFPPPDMSPFFLKQYVKSHAHDVFEGYPQLLTEMALRLPYQTKKISEANYGAVEPTAFVSEWHTVLCDYMMTHQTPYVRRQARKLLLYVCGTKDKYRELRDLHTLESHMSDVKKILGFDVSRHAEKETTERNSALYSLAYDTLLRLIEHLNACVEIATSRTINWQKYCLDAGGESILTFLLRISHLLDDGVSPIVLQLLQSAICPIQLSPTINQPLHSSSNVKSSRSTKASSPVKSSSRQRGEKSKSEEPISNNDILDQNSSQFQQLKDQNDIYCTSLVNQINQHSCFSDGTIENFIEKFLLECNSTAVRWQGHSLILSIQKNSSLKQQRLLLDILWKLWHKLPNYGRKAAQFVDLLGYFALKTNQQDGGIKTRSYVKEAVNVLRSQNKSLAYHPNAALYANLAQLVQLNGYYLESDPCLVCNNPEVPYTSLKLSSLKVDTKYTTTTQIVKLACSHSISKISLRIGDLKRQKMVRAIKIYYNNRSVQAVVELKNRPTMWHMAKKVNLTAGQTDIKIEFPLPITACNLMIEYADFFENVQASSETLQCPRCSASVPANPGVCSNCGENVYQCHKCRSINYDEKDPFLCNACGFCKYAKFEYTLTTRLCCAVDPIENEEDRKKAIFSINSLLDKADKVYKQLILNKPVLESWITKISESGGTVGFEESTNSQISSSGAQVNHYIQQLALRYCGDCKNSFEELSKIIQKVMATRKELVTFDTSRKNRNSNDLALNESQPQSNLLNINQTSTSNTRKHSSRCYGCASASVEHCLTLLRALATNPASREELYQQGLIQQLMEHNLRRGTLSTKHEVRKLICLLTRDNENAAEHLNGLICEKVEMALKGHARGHPDLVESVRHDMTLLAVTLSREDSCWEMRLKCVMKIFLWATRGISYAGLQIETKDDPEFSMNLSPAVMDNITLPCLKILYDLAKPVISGKPTQILGTFPSPHSAKVSSRKPLFAKEMSGFTKYETAFGFKALDSLEGIDVERWIAGEADSTFSMWDTKNFKIMPEQGKPNSAVVLDTNEIERKDIEIKPRRSSSPSIREFSVVSSSHAIEPVANIKVETAVMDSFNSAMTNTELAKFPITPGLHDKSDESHIHKLKEKYFKSWSNFVSKNNHSDQKTVVSDVKDRKLAHTVQSSWLKKVMFNPSSRMARQVACNMIESFCLKPGISDTMGNESENFNRKKYMLDLLTTFLDELGEAGECSAEFVSLYLRLIGGNFPTNNGNEGDSTWKLYLAVKGVLFEIAKLITSEIEEISKFESLTLGSDLSQGYALKTLSDIFASFISVPRIKSAYKKRLLSTVLNGYLSLRRLVVQRTKLIDQTQEKLLEMLEDMTTGTEEETKNFMAVCVQTIEKYPTEDQLTPVFVFERLCQLIYPEETDTGEFFMTLEKDPQQEDFLQGRMLGNPYSSTEQDMGPLMREIKNKICTDCELVALLEDDNGMELLVNNKIISLDLPVKDVYQKVWIPALTSAGLNTANGASAGQDTEPMRIVYRMRGLLGDATEEFIENLADKEGEDEESEEEVYHLANVMAECGGLEVMLARLSFVREDVSSPTSYGYSKQLLAVLLKLFGHCIKVKKNREMLLRPSFRTIPILLHCLKSSLGSGIASGSIGSTNFESNQNNAISSNSNSISEQILGIMEKLLVEAATMSKQNLNDASNENIGPSGDSNSITVYCRFASDGVTSGDIQTLLEHAVNLKAGTSLHQRLLRVLPFLTYANKEKMAMIICHFEDVLDFAKFDTGASERNLDDEAKMEAFVALCDGVERNDIGNTMKSQLIELGIIRKCLNYISENAPKIKSHVPIKSVGDELTRNSWKEFVSRSSLRYILRALAGLAVKHAPTQLAISETCIPVLHQMEQVSSDEHIGSLAEAVLEAIRGHPEVDMKVQKVRNDTKAEKKRLAMAMRAKQLKAIGLKANDAGQVKAESVQRFQQFSGLGDEKGLCCNICREGYKFQPNKVLAIYTYTRPSNVDEFEFMHSASPHGHPLATSGHHRRSMGYSTVTHFNLVHVDCHMAAVRLQRGRDEWESAMLQNANTRCNGLLPLWGPAVAESAFASCLARHNTYLMEATQHRDIGYVSTLHDMKLLLLKFSNDQSFSSESGGGGAQSNMHLVPYLAHMALYVLNTTRSVPREDKNLTTFLDTPKDKWLEQCYVTEGPHYQTALAMLILSPSRWKSVRVLLLQRLLLCAHARSISSSGNPRCTTFGASGERRVVKEYGTVYKPVILYFALIDQMYEHMFNNVSLDANEWSVALAEWIRHNDESLLKSTSRVLTIFQEDLVPATSVDEMIDVCGLMQDIPNPQNFLLELLLSVP